MPAAATSQFTFSQANSVLQATRLQKLPADCRLSSGVHIHGDDVYSMIFLMSD